MKKRRARGEGSVFKTGRSRFWYIGYTNLGWEARRGEHREDDEDGRARRTPRQASHDQRRRGSDPARRTDDLQ